MGLSKNAASRIIGLRMATAIFNQKLCFLATREESHRLITEEYKVAQA